MLSCILKLERVKEISSLNSDNYQFTEFSLHTLVEMLYIFLLGHSFRGFIFYLSKCLFIDEDGSIGYWIDRI